MSAFSVVQHPVLSTSRKSSANKPLHRPTHVPLQTSGFLYGSAKARSGSSSTQSLEASYVGSPPVPHRSASACKPMVPTRSGSSQASLHSWSSAGSLEQHLPCSAPPQNSPRPIHTRQVAANPAPFMLPKSETPSTPRSPRQTTFIHRATVEGLPVHRSRSCILTRLPDGRLAARAQVTALSPRQSSSAVLVQSISSHPFVDPVRSPRLLQRRSPPNSSARFLGAEASNIVGKQARAGERVIATVDLSLGKVRNMADYSLTGGSCYPSSLNNSVQWSTSMSLPSSEIDDTCERLSGAMSSATSDFESSPTLVNAESFKDLRRRFDSKESIGPEELSPACSARMSVPVCFINLFQSENESPDYPKADAPSSSSRLDNALTKTHRTLGLQPEPEATSPTAALVTNLEHDNQSTSASQEPMVHSSHASGCSESEATACSWPTSKRTSPSVSREKIQMIDELALNVDTSTCSQSKDCEIDESPVSQDSPSSRNVVFEFSVSLGEASSLIAASEAARLVLTRARSSGSVESAEEKGDAQPLSKTALDVGADSQQAFCASQQQFCDSLSDLDTAADDCPDDGLSPISHCIKDRGTLSEPSSAVSGMELEEAVGLHVDKAFESSADMEEGARCHDAALSGAIDALVSGPTFQDVTLEARDILCRVRRDVSKHFPQGTDEADVARIVWSRIYEEVGKQLQHEVVSQGDF